MCVLVIGVFFVGLFEWMNSVRQQVCLFLFVLLLLAKSLGRELTRDWQHSLKAIVSFDIYVCCVVQFRVQCGDGVWWVSGFWLYFIVPAIYY